jgi:hypothetical protein
MFVTHHPSLREHALRLRREENLTIDEIAARLALHRSTIYYWVRGTPRPRTERQSAARQRASRRNSLRAKRLRDAAYRQGLAEFDRLCRERSFRDFVALYIGEGFKRNRNVVSLGNSNPDVVRLAGCWMRRLSARPLGYQLQYHADQDFMELARFWSVVLEVPPEAIRFQRKSNSNNLAGRRWRSRWGVLTVRTNDTYLRARLQAWMEAMQASWVDCAEVSGA